MGLLDKIMSKYRSPRIIASLTTYPARIRTVSSSIGTILKQTVRPDMVLLWLAEEQFPKKEKELPEELLDLVKEKKLTIRWCDDLRSHKKYFYALQEYDHDLVITFDDDIYYDEHIIERLMKSYEKYPDAISAVRVHVITMDEEKIFPYDLWIKECEGTLGEPSLQAMATTGAGTLYPPKILPKEIFDKEKIKELCPTADDIWLKMNEIVHGIPVVLASENIPIIMVEGSQNTSLVQQNVDQGENDTQIARIREYLEEKYGKGIVLKKLREYPGKKYLTVEDYCSLMGSHLETLRKQRRKQAVKEVSYKRIAEEFSVFAEDLLEGKEETLREYRDKIVFRADKDEQIRRNGLVFEEKRDGSVRITGEMEEEKKTTFTLVNREKDDFYLEAGEYYLFGIPKGTDHVRLWLGSEDRTVSCTDRGEGVTFVLHRRQRAGITVDVLKKEKNICFFPGIYKLK